MHALRVLQGLIGLSVTVACSGNDMGPGDPASGVDGVGGARTGSTGGTEDVGSLAVDSLPLLWHTTFADLHVGELSPTDSGVFLSTMGDGALWQDTSVFSVTANHETVLAQQLSGRVASGPDGSFCASRTQEDGTTLLSCFDAAGTSLWTAGLQGWLAEVGLTFDGGVTVLIEGTTASVGVGLPSEALLDGGDVYGAHFDSAGEVAWAHALRRRDAADPSASCGLISPATRRVEADGSISIAGPVCSGNVDVLAPGQPTERTLEEVGEYLARFDRNGQFDWVVGLGDGVAVASVAPEGDATWLSLVMPGGYEAVLARATGEVTRTPLVASENVSSTSTRIHARPDGTAVLTTTHRDDVCAGDFCIPHDAGACAKSPRGGSCHYHGAISRFTLSPDGTYTDGKKLAEWDEDYANGAAVAVLADSIWVAVEGGANGGYVQIGTGDPMVSVGGTVLAELDDP